MKALGLKVRKNWPDSQKGAVMSSSESKDTFLGGTSARTLLSWFAGARRAVLERCEGEIPFFNGLGLAVLTTALLSSVTLMIALGYALNEPADKLWPVALVWGVAILNIDRLLVMLTASRHLFWAILPRIVISFVLGAMIAEIFTLRIYQPEINAQLRNDVQVQLQASTNKVDAFYGPQIATDERTITELQDQENGLVSTINRDMFLSSCENQDPVCSTTHLPGCGAFCIHYQQLAASARSELNQIKPRDDVQISRLEYSIAGLNHSEAIDRGQLISTVKTSSGLIAREVALGQLEHAHSEILVGAWFLRVALLLFDLLPLTVKVLYVLFADSAYEAIVAALKRREGLLAYELDQGTEVERNRLHDEARAQEDINRADSQGRRDRGVAEAEEQWYDPKSDSRRVHESSYAHHRGWNRDMSLHRFADDVQRSGSHERLPVPTPRVLSIAGWVGSLLTAALLVGMYIHSGSGHGAVAGMWVVFLVLVAELALASFTRGFRRAPAWAMRATFVVLLVGLCLPVAIAALNV